MNNNDIISYKIQKYRQKLQRTSQEDPQYQIYLSKYIFYLEGGETVKERIARLNAAAAEKAAQLKTAAKEKGAQFTTAAKTAATNTATAAKEKRGQIKAQIQILSKQLQSKLQSTYTEAENKFILAKQQADKNIDKLKKAVESKYNSLKAVNAEMYQKLKDEASKITDSALKASKLLEIDLNNSQISFNLKLENITGIFGEKIKQKVNDLQTQYKRILTNIDTITNIPENFANSLTEIFNRIEAITAITDVSNIDREIANMGSILTNITNTIPEQKSFSQKSSLGQNTQSSIRNLTQMAQKASRSNDAANIAKAMGPEFEVMRMFANIAPTGILSWGLEQTLQNTVKTNRLF